MLTVTDINVWYGVTEVLRRVSFHVPEGNIWNARRRFMDY